MGFIHFLGQATDELHLVPGIPRLKSVNADSLPALAASVQGALLLPADACMPPSSSVFGVIGHPFTLVVGTTENIEHAQPYLVPLNFPNSRRRTF